MKRLTLDDAVVVAGLGVVGGIVGALAGGEGKYALSAAVGAGIAASSYLSVVTAGQYAVSAVSHAVKYIAGRK